MAQPLRAALTETCNVYPFTTEGPADVRREDFEQIRQANVDHHLELIRFAAARQVKIICLGELFPAPYPAITAEPNLQWLDFAEDVEEGPTIQQIRAVTSELSLVVIAPIYELDQRTGKRYNTAVVVDHGEVIGRCRKTHIPHGRNEQGPFTEGFYYGKSDDPRQNEGKPRVITGEHPLLPAFETSVGRIGVNICYGRHFPETWRILRQQGAKLVFSPAITFGETSHALWQHEFPAAAGQNGYFVGASNRQGKDFSKGPEFFGESYFVGPDGKGLLDVSVYSNLVISDIDLERAFSDPAGWRLAENERGNI